MSHRFQTHVLASSCRDHVGIINDTPFLIQLFEKLNLLFFSRFGIAIGQLSIAMNPSQHEIGVFHGFLDCQRLDVSPTFCTLDHRCVLVQFIIEVLRISEQYSWS